MCLVNKGISGNDNGKGKTLLAIPDLNCCYMYCSYVTTHKIKFYNLVTSLNKVANDH